MSTEATKKSYVLVHGAWGAAWEFDELRDFLSADGSDVLALDLPGHGDNPREIADVTMAAYTAHVQDAVGRIKGKVILVGHSLGGAIISQVAEATPEKIEYLIYVAAMLPKAGDSALALMQSDTAGQLLPRLIFSEDKSYAILNLDIVKEVLLHDVADKKRLDTIAPDFLVKQATEPFMAEIELSAGRFGTVPKYYIRASEDKVLSPALQDRMITNWKVEEVFTLPSGHFPITSVAEDLSEVIKSIR